MTNPADELAGGAGDRVQAAPLSVEAWKEAGPFQEGECVAAAAERQGEGGKAPPGCA